MGNYIPNFTEKDLLINYLNDQITDLSYDKMKRLYFIELSFFKWAASELKNRLDDNPLYSEMSARQIVKEYKDESQECSRLAKTFRSKMLFDTALNTAIDCEDFLRAKGGRG